MASLALPISGCLGGDDDPGRSVTQGVTSQLTYLDPQSSLVAAIDLDYEGDNWKRLRPLASRLLQEFREAAGPEEGLQVSPNLDGALEQLASFGGVSFKDDVRPVLDGRLVVGVSVPPRRPLPSDFAEVERLLPGAVLDPSRGVFVRPRRDARPPAPPSPTSPSSPPSPPRVAGRVVRRSNGRPLRQAEVFRYQRAREARARAAEPRTVLVYRTRDGDLRELAQKVFDRRRLKPIAGHDDAALLGSGLAVVGDDTLVLAQGNDDADRQLRAALTRGERGRGFPQAGLRASERDAGLDDPLLLATGDLKLARALTDEDSLGRARAEVPYLGAFRRAGGALDLDENEVKAVVRVVTDRARLRERDLPLGPAGEIELPRTEGILGASRDQSRTTVFAASVVRSLFSDSRFVDAVERAERELGIDFEDEVLRQFNCPSVSVFRTGRAGRFDAPAQRFGARSCVRDPKRMRALLPRLAPHLPRILTAMRGLGDEGLLGLLLVAPDAPLTPSTLGVLAQIVVRPFKKEGGGAPREQLYEVDGLRQVQPGGPPVLPGPERVVFGMIGDSFVVGSDRAMARGAAKLDTRPAPERGASALRVPIGSLLDPDPGDEVSRAVADVFDELLVSFSATPRATVARARAGYEP